MFATLLGPLPRPPLPAVTAGTEVLEGVLGLQIEHGLDPLTTAGWDPNPDDVVRSWRIAADLASDRLVKAVVRFDSLDASSLAAAARTHRALADAGCAWIEVHDAAVVSDPGVAGSDAGADVLARIEDAHARLARGLDGLHRTFAIADRDGSPIGLGPVLAGGYASLAVDLITGPDHWRMVAALPGDRGVIAGALTTRPGGDDGPEVVLWAGGYAASTKGRGPDRVGLATAGSLAHLSWDEAAARVARLGEVLGLAQLPPEERKRRVDPRSVDIRSAALGRYDPNAPRPGRRVSRKAR